MTAMDLLAMPTNRWGGLGLPCEAQPAGGAAAAGEATSKTASRANPQENRRSLPPSSGRT
jgi:hypothetical protein